MRVAHSSRVSHSSIVAPSLSLFDFLTALRGGERGRMCECEGEIEREMYVYIERESGGEECILYRTVRVARGSD